MRMPSENRRDLGWSGFCRVALEEVASELNSLRDPAEIERILGENILFMGISGSPSVYYLDLVDGEYVVRPWRGERIDPEVCPTKEIPSAGLSAAYTGLAPFVVRKRVDSREINLKDREFPEGLLAAWGKLYSISELNEVRRY
jgi:hypothetical protein